MSFIAIVRIFAIYLLAVIVASLLGGVGQAQVNLAAMPEAPVALAERLTASGSVLIELLPVFALMVAAAFLVALPLAEGLSRIFRPWRWLLFALLGAGGIWVAQKAVTALLQSPVINMPAAGWQWAAVLLPVAVGSWLFGYLTRPRSKRGLRVLG